MKLRFYILILCFLPIQMLSQSNSDTLRKHVVKLGASPFARNYQHVEYLNSAAAYIQSYFSKSSSKVFIQKYEMDTKQFKNVIASFGPDSAARIIIGAHYDVFGESPGADVNASGVAGLLELARLLHSIEKSLLYRIDLVAYTLGESPFLNTELMGSFVHAKSLNENNIKVLGMINLNEIGYFTDKPKSQHYPFFLYRWMHGRTGNFISLVQQPGNGLWPRQMRYLFKQYTNGLRVINFKPAIPFKGMGSGDQKSYWQFNYPAIAITDLGLYRNKNYHYDTDTYETLDYFRMSKVIDMIFKSLLHFKA